MAVAGLALVCSCASVAVAERQRLESVPAVTKADFLTPRAESQMRQLAAQQDAAAAAERQWRRSPEARAALEASRERYRDYDPREAKDLATRTFGDQLDVANDFPTPLAERITHYIDDKTARVADAEGSGGRILESTYPLRVLTEQGEKAPVSLELRRSPSGFEPENPLAPIEIPIDASGPLTLEHPSVSLRPEAASTKASPGAPTPDGQVFYADIQADTDLIVSPVATGLELLTQLRSPASPESQRFDVSLPQGARLVEEGGAVLVVRGDQLLVTVSAPRAVDAQGRDVASALRLRGDQIELTTPHRSRDLAYPILVDPYVTEHFAYFDRGSGQAYPEALRHWEPLHDNKGLADYALRHTCAGLPWPDCHTYSGQGDGLYVYSYSYSWYAQGSYGAWAMWAPNRGLTSDNEEIGTAFVSSMALYPYTHTVYGSGYRSPVTFAGAFNYQYGWAYGFQIPEDGYTRVDQGLLFEQGGEPVRNASRIYWMLYAPRTAPTDTWHIASLGGGDFLYDDPESPTLNVTSVPSGWLGSEDQSLGLESADPGLGVHRFTLSAPHRDGGTAEFSTPSKDGGCTGAHASPCPISSSRSLGFDPDLIAEGTHEGMARAYDAYGHASGRPVTLKVDHTAPELNSISGPLVDSPDPLIGAMTAVDFDLRDPLSGTTRAALKVNGHEVAAVPQDCPSGGCGLEGELFADLSDFEPGGYTYSVEVADAAGNTRTIRSGNFTLDPKLPSLHVSGPLPDSSGQELSSDTVDAHIAGSDNRGGDTGIARIEVSVDETVDFVAAPHCDPSCPGTLSRTYTYDRRDWSPGEHLVEITASDRAGNEATTSFVVNTPPDLPDPICPVVTPTVQPSLLKLDADQAKNLAPSSAYSPSQPADDPVSESRPRPFFEQAENPPPEPLYSGDSIADVKAATVAAGGVSIEHEVCLMPMQTTSDESAALITHDTGDPDYPKRTDAIIYPNSATNADTIVRPTAVGFTIVQSLRGAGLPTSSYSWQLGLGSGLQLHQLSYGGIAVVDPGQTPRSAPVPPRPSNAQDPNAIPDVATQLGETYHQIARAEQETGRFVYSVITPPYAINALGQSEPAPLTLNNGKITVQATPAAKALVLPVVDDNRYKGPIAVPASYLSYENPDLISFVAKHSTCGFSKRVDGRMRTRLLDFGRASYKNGEYGTELEVQRGYFYSNARISGALQSAVAGWRDSDCPHPGDAGMRLTYGASNHRITNNLPAGIALQAGRRQQGVMGRVSRKVAPHSTIRMAVAHDSEPGFAYNLGAQQGVERTVEWVKGMMMHRYPVIAYGTAGGCNDSEPGCKYGWDAATIAYISQGQPGEKRIWSYPEIYESDWVGDWRVVQKTWNQAHAHDYIFDGVTGAVCANLPAFRSWQVLRRKVPTLRRELVNINCPFKHQAPDPEETGPPQDAP